MSLVSRPQENSTNDEVMIIGLRKPEVQKVLEEEEYLGRMSKIIRRDYFGDIEFPETSWDSPRSSTRTATTRATDQISQGTPGTDRTSLSTTSLLKDRRKACSMTLDDYLDRYTSEDNAYFEKLQRKELKRHRLRYPWLYKDRTGHNEKVRRQLQLPSIHEQASVRCRDSAAKLIDWPYNPKNSLFYPPDESRSSKKSQTIINHNSNKCLDEPRFKVPMQPRDGARTSRGLNGFKDKIGIDGKLLNGSETPMINGYSFIPAPDTPKIHVTESKIKTETNKFYIPGESPRDALASRLYQEKVAKAIRTPKNTIHDTPTLRKTPLSGRSYADFSFSPERVKTRATSNRHK